MATTIACPTAMSHPAINPETAPIWVDAFANQYRVASGVLDALDGGPFGPTAQTIASPDGITIVVGVDGLEALAQMGLTATPDTSE